VGQHAPRRLEQGDARVREGDAALAAVEEPDPELLLELADLLAHRRLDDVQTLRGLAEVKLLRDRDEVHRVPELARCRLRTLR
jgi:hypothetical protein